MTPSELIQSLEALHVRLWLDEGQLRYKAPKGAITPEILGQLKAHKAAIIEYLTDRTLSDAQSDLGPKSIAAFTAPLSFNQRGLWFIHELAPESDFSYNIPEALDLVGTLNERALEQALQCLINRHQALRTRFIKAEQENGEEIVLQEILSEALLPHSIENLEGYSDADIAKRIDLEIQSTFDLSTAPLLRSCLFKLGGQHAILVITLHHIIADGWSKGLLTRELALAYQHYLETGNNHHTDPVPGLTPDVDQYPDYATWQQNVYRTQELPNHVAYWKSRLLEAPELLEVMHDYPRPQQRKYNGESYFSTLDANLSRALSEEARKQGCSTFMLLFSAFNILLYRLSGCRDLIVGTQTANRHTTAVEKTVGFFVNTLALRTQIQENITFSELLQQVKTSVLSDFEHQSMPFDQLIEQISPERHSTYEPLTQVMFLMQNVPMGNLSLPGLSIQPRMIRRQSAKFDLTLIMSMVGNQFQCEFEYSTELYKAETIVRLNEYFLNILKEVLEQPDILLSAIKMMPDKEIERIKQFQSRTIETCYSANQLPLADQSPVASQSLVDRFEQIANNSPQAIAVADTVRHYSYAQLDTLATRCASKLRQIRGDLQTNYVGICVQRSNNLIIAILGVLKAGMAYVPLDSKHPPARLMSQINDAKLQYLITDENLAPALTPLVSEYRNQHRKSIDSGQADNLNPNAALELLQLSSLTSEPLAGEKPSAEDKSSASTSESKYRVDFQVSPEDIAYCIFTSGSTGLPKGAVLHHKNVINLVHGLHSLIYCKYVAPINIALIANPIFDASVQQIFAALALGHKLTIVPEALRLQPEALVNYLNEQSINVFDCTPTLLNIMVNQETVAELTADYCLVGGEALPPDLVKRFYAQNPHTQLVNLYGPTECCVDASAFIVPRADKDQNRSTAIAIGKPLPGVSIRVCDSDFNDMPISVAGEIVISGAGVGSGYLNREALTRDVFTPSGYRTGDIGFWDTEGNLHFVGRRDHQVKVRGYRVETGEIEQILVSHPAIQEAVCQVIDDELEAFFTSEVSILPDDLRDHCLTRLPTYMVPHHFYQVDAIPKTASYKIDRRALQKQKSLHAMASHSNHSHATTTQRPEFHSLQQQVLYDTWSAVLKTDAFSLDDRFFNLGGDSIKALQVASRLKSQGWIMAVKALFDHQSIRELAPHIQEISSKQNDRHASSRMITQVPVSGIQYWFLNHHSDGNQRLQNHYNQSVLLKPEAPISISQLESALTVLVSHHSALRSSFQVKENLWFQSLNEPSSIKISDICNVVQIKSTTDLTQYANQYQSSFSIQSAPLIKVVLFNITNGDTADIIEQRLLLVAHHLIVDAVSWRIIISDLAELITEPATSNSKPISEAMVESCSFLHWLASVQQSTQQKPCLFWQSIIAQLAEMDFTAPFNALADQYQVAIPPQTDKIAPQRIIQKQNLDPELTDRLLTYANQSYNTSTEELLATAFLITLGDFGIDPWLLMEGHGRETGLLNTSDQLESALDLSRAVGWFTSLYPVCFKRENSCELENSLKTENSLGQKTDYDRYIKIVKETLRSIPEKGAGFSHQFYRPASNQDGVPLTSLPLVAFNFLGEFGTEFGANLFNLADESTGANHAPLANHTRAKNYTGPCLELVLLIRNNVLEWELQGDSRYLNQAMLVAISTSLNDRINAIIAHTTAQKEEVLTPSDIDFDGFDVDQLDAFLEKITE